jgi:hypothetical protein
MKTITEHRHTYIEKEQTMEAVIEKLTNISLVGHPDIAPYANATITLEEIALSEIRPIALYVVTHALARQFVLRSNLQSLGHDTLHLGSALRISHDGNSVGLIPPIVEETDDGLCLMDGLHRSTMARVIGQSTIRVLRINNVNPDYPLTSFPNEWDEIRTYDTTPVDRALKKRYRPDSHYFRDLSTINGSRRREAGNAS